MSCTVILVDKIGAATAEVDSVVDRRPLSWRLIFIISRTATGGGTDVSYFTKVNGFVVVGVRWANLAAAAFGVRTRECSAFCEKAFGRG